MFTDCGLRVENVTKWQNTHIFRLSVVTFPHSTASKPCDGT
jgi:hypothetical protein